MGVLSKSIYLFGCGLFGHSALAIDDNSNEGTQARC